MRGTDAPNRLFMKEVGLAPSPTHLHFFFFLSDLFCLRSSRFQYVIMPQHLFACFLCFVHFDIKLNVRITDIFS